MRLTVLACWGVMAVLVVVTEAKPYSPPAFDIAAAYEAYHQLWMSEARRNAVAPVSFNQQVARTWPGMRPAVRRRPATLSAAVAERPPQKPLAAGSDTKNAMVDQKTQEPVATEGQTEAPMTTEQQPEMTTEGQTQDTMMTEPPVTEPTVQEEVTTEAQVQEQTTQQTNVNTKSANKEASPQQQTPQQTTADTRAASRPASPKQQSVSSTRHAPTQMQAAFDNFFDIWNAERVRNSIAPVATPIPPLSRPFLNMKRTRLRKQPMATKPVDRPTQAPAKKPMPEEPVDTLTQKAATSAPVAIEVAAPTAAAPTAAAAPNVMSLVNPTNWGQQGGSPLIIILQQPGAATPVLG